MRRSLFSLNVCWITGEVWLREGDKLKKRVGHWVAGIVRVWNREGATEDGRAPTEELSPKLERVSMPSSMRTILLLAGALLSERARPRSPRLVI